MPEISRFHGIIIRMFAEFGAPHHAPHFHAYHQDFVAIYTIDPVELVAGGIPVRHQRFVEEWAELHRRELLADWRLLQEGRRPAPIEPLR
jgi:hypothetical protein